MTSVPGRVLFDFDAEGFPELSVKEGDRVEAHYFPKGSQWLYVHTKTGRKGYIPVDFFEEDGIMTSNSNSNEHAVGMSEEEADVIDSRLGSHDTHSAMPSSQPSSYRPPTLSRRHSKSDRIARNFMDSVSSFSQPMKGRTTSATATGGSPDGYVYMPSNAQSTSSRDAAVNVLAANAAAQASKYRQQRASSNSEGGGGGSGGSAYHSRGVNFGETGYTRPQRMPGEIPEQILKQVSGYPLSHCVLVTFHREFVPQIPSLLGYFGSQFGVILNRMKIRYDEVRPYTIAVFEHADAAERVLGQTEHLVHDKSRVTKPIRIRVFPLFDYSRVFP